MIPKIISPSQHGLADWGFVAWLLIVPRLLNVNKKAQKMYNAFAADVVAINSITNHGVGVSPIVSVKTHRKVDYANLALLGGLTAAKSIRKDSVALKFHIGLIGLAVVTILLTDYDDQNPQQQSK
ncbi:hypothetical protein GR160_19065 [Flavobacterium sp. Sd200]|uniref:hypothetical protein n=1 Tax=Flavobacterium sp. Sd200 TaxID=2692211 RepID=UPI00136C9492|nr:hypothetical protein [Flavobacterium sp. Sd200]MXN93331.1 hypothetical protein [Flavobacterium sp. Sd200]